MLYITHTSGQCISPWTRTYTFSTRNIQVITSPGHFSLLHKANETWFAVSRHHLHQSGLFPSCNPLIHEYHCCWMRQSILTINVERFAGRFYDLLGIFMIAFLWFSRVPRKFSHKYKHLPLIILNNKHFWLRQCKSISAQTSVGLKPWTFSPVNLSMSTVYHG